MPTPSKSGNASGTAARNIESIIRIEKEDEEKLLLHHRVFHAVGHFIGTPYCGGRRSYPFEVAYLEADTTKM